MKKNRNIQLLKEYVRASLNEDEYGDIAAGFDSSAYGGIGGGPSGDLYKVFIEPATDVFKTAVGQAKEITTKAKTLLSVTFTSIVTTLVPGLKYSYSEMFEKEKESIEKIRGEYSDVYARTAESLSGSDFAVLAFMAAPGASIAAVTAKEGPGVAKGILSVATGGASDTLFDKVKSINYSDSKKKGDEKYQSNKNNSVEEYQIVEDDEDDQKKKPDSSAIDKKILMNKKFIEKALDNPRAKSMSVEATKIYRSTLNNVLNHVQKVMKETKSIEDLQKMTKKSIKGIEKLKELQGDEKKKAEAALFKSVKSTMKDFYVKELTDHYKAVVKAGIPEDSQYIKDYKAIAQKIKSLT